MEWPSKIWYSWASYFCVLSQPSTTVLLFLGRIAGQVSSPRDWIKRNINLLRLRSSNKLILVLNEKGTKILIIYSGILNQELQMFANCFNKLRNFIVYPEQFNGYIYKLMIIYLLILLMWKNLYINLNFYNVTCRIYFLVHKKKQWFNFTNSTFLTWKLKIRFFDLIFNSYLVFE